MLPQKTLFDRQARTWPARLARGLLRLGGWRVEGRLPRDLVRCVLIGAPHTSRWDFWYMLLGALVLRLDLRWVASGPMGKLRQRLTEALGGMVVPAGQHPGFLVAHIARSLKQHPGRVQLVLSPHTLDHRGQDWHTGFYWIARSAQVPVVLAYIDYGRRCVGLGPQVHLSGDIQADMRTIRKFYANIQARHPIA
ncbi:glycerol acyltransferase [Ideonella livida]|uniref:Glycerol acyltransferase n=1 Tax=Ideonella livida TaxID=2707176 RepID=A0A7C9TJ07_9BURK|nr:glycerol acyltransferase [Ideonella livida]NDY91640.1 glycerol acyltransferase [Ideonella livida]